MSDPNYISLNKPRSWSETLSATIDIVRHHYSSLFLYVIKHVLPWLLVAAGLTAYGTITGFGAFLSGDIEAIGQALREVAVDEMALSGVIIALGYLLLFVVAGWHAAIVMTWLRAYRDAGAVPSVEQLAEAKALHTSRVFAVILSLVGAFILATGVVAVPIVALASSLDTFSAIGIVFLGFIVFVPLTVYASVALLLTLPVSVFVETGFLESVKIAFSTIRGHWWWMLGYYIVISLLVGICSYLFAIPDSIVGLVHTMVRESNDESLGIFGIVRVVTSMLSLTGAQLLSTITYVSVGVAYCSIVENRQGLSLAAMAASFAPSDQSAPSDSSDSSDTSDTSAPSAPSDSSAS